MQVAFGRILFLVINVILSGAAVSGKDFPRKMPPALSNYMGCENLERVPLDGYSKSVPTVSGETERKYVWDDTAQEPADNHLGEQPCFTRADGIWRPDLEPSLRKDFNVRMWTGDPNLSALAHGTYTQPNLVVLDLPQDGKKVIVYDVADTMRRSIYIQEDETPLSFVMSNRGASKFYVANGDALHGNRLELGTTQSGRSELRIGSNTYLRPLAQKRFGHCLRGEDAEGDSIAAAFLTIENLRSIQRGYDVVFQNPFFLLDNSKSAIFNLSAKKCLVERFQVPEGWTLILDGTQGSMTHRSVVTSETEHQSVTASNYGFDVQVGGGENPDTGLPNPGIGYGYAHAKSEVEGMRESNTVGSTIAYSRQKTMALIFNEGEVALSDRFVDLVYRIYRIGPENTEALDEMIRVYGTHYPYAVTFGANAKLTRNITLEAYTESLQKDSSFKHSGAVQGLGSKLTATYGELSGTNSVSTDSFETEDATFVAVNGNGSWNESGYSSGASPVPILLDLRRLETLLSPAYFPDEPEIYTTVRDRVAEQIEAYLTKYQLLLTEDSLAPRLPTPDEDVFVFRESKGRSVAVIVCEATDVGLAGYAATGSGAELNKLEIIVERGRPFEMRRSSQSWEAFEAKSGSTVTELWVAEDGAIRVGLRDHHYSAITKRVNDPRVKQDYLKTLEAAGKPCWDPKDLEEEIEAAQGGQE